MRVLKTLLKCIIILVVLFLLSAAESLADWFASVIDGDLLVALLAQLLQLLCYLLLNLINLIKL